MQDALGFSLDIREAFVTPPGVIIYGPPGIGKTTAIAQAFQDALFLCSKPNILAPYGSWWATLDAERKKKYRPYSPVPGAPEPLARYSITRDDCQKRQLSTKAFLSAIMARISDGAFKGVKPYSTLVLDEMTDLSNRVLEEMSTDPAYLNKNGKLDGFALADGFKGWHRSLMRFPAQTGIALVTVCHSREPSFFAPNNEKVASEKRGELQYKGGPAYAWGSLVEPMCADADFVIQLEPVSDGLGPVKRMMLTELDDRWMRKARDFRIPAKVEMTEASLQKLLQNINLKF